MYGSQCCARNNGTRGVVEIVIYIYTARGGAAELLYETTFPSTIITRTARASVH